MKSSSLKVDNQWPEHPVEALSSSLKLWPNPAKNL
jgi:hypothetical protein